MLIESATIFDLTTLGLPKPECQVYVIHVKINDVNARAKEIIETVLDTSWITGLSVIKQAAYSATISKTVEKLVTDILAKVDGKVTEDFGEYLVSDSAGLALQMEYSHKKLAIAELWKEQASGNPGFDFHTESHTTLIAYGEAKYNSGNSPYTIALDQIGLFVTDKKDEMDFIHLENMVSPQAMTNALGKKRGYIAAFSLNAKNIDKVFENALKSASAQKLYCHSELYLIGVEICS